MGKSARILGAPLNLTAEEMNELFKLNGLLAGEPGEYEVTEAGEPYATERDEHRGPGGSSWYNRDWTVLTWDDSVMGTLDTSPEMIREAKENVSERRRARRMVNEEDEIDEAVVLEEDESEDDDDYNSYDCLDTESVVKGAVIAGAVVGAIIAAPHIRKLYKEKIKPACRRVWSKIAKRPYEPLDTPAVLEEQSAELTDQGECMEQKDDE